MTILAARVPESLLIHPSVNWVQGEDSVSVFQEAGTLKYSITKTSGAETGTVSLALYDRPELKQIALQFITIFKRVLIGNNSTEHCFLPIFWTTLKRPNPSLLVALFARIRPVGVTGNKEVAEALWGIYNENGVTQEDKLKWLEVEADDHNTRDFLINAPFYRDERDDYCFRFKEEILLGPDGHVQSITLNRRAILLVKDWVADDSKKIAVFLEDDILKYAIKNAFTRNTLREEGTISLALYDTPKLKKIALLFISIFKRALLGSRSTEHCFLPIFWTIHERPSPAQHALIALFARVSPTGVRGDKEVVEACWGVCEGSKGFFLDSFEVRKPGKLQWLDAGIGDLHTRNLATHLISDSLRTDQTHSSVSSVIPAGSLIEIQQLTRGFLENAPFYHKTRKEIMGMDIYSQHFKEVIASGPDHKIQSIALKCVSALDDTIPLDENNWAITLISFQAGLLADFNIGHAQIIWEGIEAGNYFLRCAEILNQKYPHSRPGYARIRIVDTFIPNDQWRIGPTWSRTKELTNRMVTNISLAPLDAPRGTRTGWFDIVPFTISASAIALLTPSEVVERQRSLGTFRENCLSFAVSRMRHAEIFLPQPGVDTLEVRPSDYIDSLWVNYTFPLEDTRIVYRKISFLARWQSQMNLVRQKNRFRIRGPERFSVDGCTWVFRSLISSLPNRNRRIMTVLESYITVRES